MQYREAKEDELSQKDGASITKVICVSAVCKVIKNHALEFINE